MERKLYVYDWRIIARDEDFRKYKKHCHLECDVDESFNYPIGTELHLGNSNVARITKYTVDLVNSIEYIEAVTLNKWID